MPMRSRSVCLFGTSADPPTGVGGHRGIVEALSNLLLLPQESETNNTKQRRFKFDEIRVIPVYRHMFSSKREKQASYNDRIEMCRLAFQGIDRVTVSDCEKRCFDRAAGGLDDKQKVSVRVGTADLLDMLLDEEPNTDFSFALGADTFMDLTALKWRRSQDVLDLVAGRLVVIYRHTESEESRYCGKDLQNRIDKVNNERSVNCSFEQCKDGVSGPAILLEIPSLEAISSSMARRTRDLAELQTMLDSEVIQYIKEKKFYSFADQKPVHEEQN